LKQNPRERPLHCAAPARPLRQPCRIESNVFKITQVARLQVAPYLNSNNSYLSAQICRAESSKQRTQALLALDPDPEPTETRPRLRKALPLAVLGMGTRARLLAVLGMGTKAQLLAALGTRVRLLPMLGTRARLLAMVETRAQLLPLLKIIVKVRIHQPTNPVARHRVLQTQGPVQRYQVRPVPPVPSLQEREVRVSSRYHTVGCSVSSV